ncbi:hypothetical protein M6B38_313020 [Iris pallida]|uniref:Uncharacterized protein n=1 Tax=Iris pallida TaxID=29817 RepID=A0AAX6HHJ5_IRIPA|nr:hypothetical protein M6B38_313020 [Iris pallida]
MIDWLLQFLQIFLEIFELFLLCWRDNCELIRSFNEQIFDSVSYFLISIGCVGLCHRLWTRGHLYRTRRSFGIHLSTLQVI